MKGVAFTFDDDALSHYEAVAPIFKKYNFRCTFFSNACAGHNFWSYVIDDNGINYNVPDMSEKQILSLHEDGFEIGNHSLSHKPTTHQTDAEAMLDVELCDQKLLSIGIPKPRTFCYPGFSAVYDSIDKSSLIKKLGFKLARIGYLPHDDKILNSTPDAWKRTREYYYIPKETDPHLVRCCGLFCDEYTFDTFKNDLATAPEESYCVFTGHVFSLDYQIEKLEKMCKYCHDNDIPVLKFEDLSV